MVYLIAFIIVFIFLKGLSLGLSLKLIYNDKRKIETGLSFISILMILTRFVFFGGSVALWVLRINLFFF